MYLLCNSEACPRSRNGVPGCFQKDTLATGPQVLQPVLFYSIFAGNIREGSHIIGLLLLSKVDYEAGWTVS